jgi:ribosomal protein S10
MKATLTPSAAASDVRALRKAQRSVLLDIKMHNFTTELMPTIGNRVTFFPSYETTGSSASYVPIPYGLPVKRTLLTVNRSPHGHKKSRDQFHLARHGMVLKGLRRYAGASSAYVGDARRSPLNAVMSPLRVHPVVLKGSDVKLKIQGGKR